VIYKPVGKNIGTGEAGPVIGGDAIGPIGVGVAIGVGVVIGGGPGDGAFIGWLASLGTGSERDVDHQHSRRHGAKSNTGHLEGMIWINH
jgi:hypothetical protein